MNRKLMMLLAPEGGEGGTAGEPAKGTTGTGDGGQGKSITGEGGQSKSITGDGGTGAGGKEGGTKPEGDKGGADLKLKIPEGVDAKVAEPYLALAKKHGLKAEAAQEMFDHALKASKEGQEAWQTDLKSTVAKTQQEWLDTAKKDPEFGGDKFKETVGLADKFVLRFGGDGLMDLLRDSGLGKHPEIIKAFAKAGKMITEDKIGGTTGEKGGGAPKSRKEQLKADYPNSPDMWQHLPD